MGTTIFGSVAMMSTTVSEMLRRTHPSMHAIVGGDFVNREFGNIGPVSVSYMFNTKGEKVFSSGKWDHQDADNLASLVKEHSN